MAEPIFIDLSAPARITDLPAVAHRAFGWWLAELVALLPVGLRQWIPEPTETAALFVRGEVWRVIPADNEGRALEFDAGASDSGLADQILAAAPNFSLLRLIVVLPRGTALRRRVEMPIMSDADLRSAVALQINRLSPFKADAVRFAVRVAERDPVEGKLIAEVAIVPRTAVEPVEQRLIALGLAPAAIDVEGEPGVRAGFDLRTPSAPASPRRALLVNFGFAVAALAIWYLAFAAWSTAREREIESWDARIAELRPLAQRSAALRQQLDAMTQPFAMAQAHKAGLSLALTAELTKLLPDTARLTELRLAGGGIELTGLANEAPALISKLEGSKFFKDVKFRSPVTRRPELNKDRFEISLKLEGGAP